MAGASSLILRSLAQRRLPAEEASLRPGTSTAAPRCTMLQRDVTVDVPGGDPRVTIINRCQIITTYHDISRPVGLAFFLVPKKFEYDCSSQSRRRLPAEVASFSIAQRDVTVDVCTPPHAFRSLRCRSRTCQCCLGIHANEVAHLAHLAVQGRPVVL